jgi:DNA-binding protein HU-beta
MLKNDVVNLISEKTGLTKTDSEKALVAFEDIVKEAMEANEEVNLSGFAKFFVADVAERQGVNPKTGERITIPAHKAIKIKVGKSLKESVK